MRRVMRPMQNNNYNNSSNARREKYVDAYKPIVVPEFKISNNTKLGA